MKSYFLVFSILCLVTIAFGQQPRLVYVEPGEGTLNIAIDSDTLAGGKRIDPENTWYVLENDGWYITIGTIQVVAPLRIVTKDYAPGGPKDQDPNQFYSPANPGQRAHLVPGLNAAGASASIFRFQGDLTLKGIHLWGRVALGFEQPTVLQKNIVMAGAPGLHLTLVDCFCERDAQAIFRLDKERLVSTFINTTMRNTGQIADPTNSRFIDTRGNNGQIMKFVNCTFINGSHHILLSGFGDGGVGEKYEVNHCSFINNGSTFAMGRVKNVEFKNSLLINNGWIGIIKGATNPDKTDRWKDIDAILDIDSLIVENVHQPQHIDIHHNNIYLNRAAFDTIFARIFKDSIGTGSERIPYPYFTPLAETGAHDNLSEDVIFTNGPGLAIDYCRNYNHYFYLRYFAGAPSSEYNAVFNALNGEFVVDTTGQNNYDFSYSTSAASYTAGSDGLPLGDLRWFPSKFSEYVTAVKECGDKLPASYVMLHNYPNPFNPSTRIVYTLTSPAKVNLIIYNILGQEVRTLINSEMMEAGKHSIQWDGRNNAGQVAPNGIYFCKLKAGDISRTHKMLMIK